jgi:hypothetical protein
MKEKLIAALKALGLIKDENQAQVIAELDKLDLEKAPVIDASKVQDAGLKQLLESIQTEISILRTGNKSLADALAAEKTEREKAIKAQQDAAAADKAKKVSEAVDAAIKAGKFPEAKREHLTKLFTNDFDSAAEIVKDAPVDKHFKPGDNNNNNNKNDKNDGMKSPLEVNSPLLESVKKFANINEN